MTQTPPPIRDASTVILVRERDELEVFLVRRNARSSFMANRFVYPGGRVDEADHSEALEARTDLTRASADRRLKLDDQRGLGFHLAAVRETFEEAGVLLARTNHPDNVLPGWQSEEQQRLRTQLQSGAMTLGELAAEYDLLFSLEGLLPFARWVTPPFEKKRFDTFFFVACVSRDAEARHDEGETTESFWKSPRRALQEYREGAFLLAPPTVRTLEQIADYDSLEALSATEVVASRSLTPIMPALAVSEADTPVLVLPGDPQYTAVGGDPDAAPVDDGVTQIEWRDGLWHCRHLRDRLDVRHNDEGRLPSSP